MRWFFTWVAGILLINSVSGNLCAQDNPTLPPTYLSEDDDKSLAGLMKIDLLRRLEDIYSQSGDVSRKKSGRRPERPRTELGQNGGFIEPIDLSEYLGPAGDPEKAWEKLVEKGKVPPLPASPDLKGASTNQTDIWKNMPVEKRLAYVDDLLKRRKFHTAFDELDTVLNMGLKGDPLVQALLMREKALFHLRQYDVVKNDYYRLKIYFPEEKRIDALKSYLEEQSGLSTLQQDVLKDPSDPAAQRKLLNQYLRFGWLDFAEEFFGETIRDISEPTIQSLCEIFYKKADYPMLIKLSREAQKLYPTKGIYYYNEGAGLYALGDPASLDRAGSVFQKAHSLAGDLSMRKNIDWYIARLSPQKRR